MKSGTLIFIVSTTFLFFSSCSDDIISLEEQNALELSSTKSPNFKKKKDKCAVCHFREESNSYKKKELPCGNAIVAHLNHGDGEIGGEVPGQPGVTFGEDCEFIESATCPCLDIDAFIGYTWLSVNYRPNSIDIFAGRNGRIYQYFEPSSCGGTYFNFNTRLSETMEYETTPAERQACEDRMLEIASANGLRIFYLNQ